LKKLRWISTIDTFRQYPNLPFNPETRKSDSEKNGNYSATKTPRRQNKRIILYHTCPNYVVFSDVKSGSRLDLIKSFYDPLSLTLPLPAAGGAS
jgi:hypothetical protein